MFEHWRTAWNSTLQLASVPEWGLFTWPAQCKVNGYHFQNGVPLLDLRFTDDVLTFAQSCEEIGPGLNMSANALPQVDFGAGKRLCDKLSPTVKILGTRRRARYSIQFFDTESQRWHAPTGSRTPSRPSSAQGFLRKHTPRCDSRASVFCHKACLNLEKDWVHYFSDHDLYVKTNCCAGQSSGVKHEGGERATCICFTGCP